jgi:hypothetical protein
MNHYLDEAAALIASAAEDNERTNGAKAREYSCYSEFSKKQAKAYQENILRLAEAYAALAAIDKGLLPDTTSGYLEAVVAKARQMQQNGDLPGFPSAHDMGVHFRLSPEDAEAARRQLLVNEMSTCSQGA